MRRAFAFTGFGRLYAGLSTSGFGDSVMLLVLSMWVKTLTGSNAQAGLTFLFMLLPSLVAPALGVWVDRVRRRPLLVWGNLASALVVLPLLLVRSAQDVWIVWTVAFLYGISFIVLPGGGQRAAQGAPPRRGPRRRERRPADHEGGLPPGRAAHRRRVVRRARGRGRRARRRGLVRRRGRRHRLDPGPGEDRPSPRGRPRLAPDGGGRAAPARGPRAPHVLVGFGIMQLVLGFTEASIYALLDGFGRPPTFAGVVLDGPGRRRHRRRARVEPRRPTGRRGEHGGRRDGRSWPPASSSSPRPPPSR